ncbi:MAG: DUF6049 family protein [Ornithinimicrobium sp.]|uniref:DUF6049 family protein n=1 Tax=Ornithinimicrobium sp. TaxID=1977084 RepID=UPI0026DEF93E|nr:DUF6049 family protein [Ornithinimicrobium sp.]MDO5739153.1 DUF6049 family protein [Ornithinimicrobium sp.]
MTSSARRRAWALRSRTAIGAVAAFLLTFEPMAVGSSALAAGSSSPLTGPHRPLGESVIPSHLANDGQLQILLDDVEPTVPRRGDPVVLRGHIVNGSTTSRRVNTLVVDASWTTLRDRRAIDRWVGDPESPGREATWRLGQDTVGPVVAAGAQIPFTVTLEAEVLAGLPADPGVLALELETFDAPPAEVATVADSSASQQVEQDVGSTMLRTVLVVTGTELVDQPLGMSWLVPLTVPADPDLSDPVEKVRNRAWVEATGPGSPARTWLERMDVPGITWMVDPALLVARHPQSALVVSPPEPSQAPDSQPTPEPTTDLTQEPAPPTATTTAAPGVSGTGAPAPTGQDGAEASTGADGSGGANSDDTATSDDSAAVTSGEPGTPSAPSTTGEDSPPPAPDIPTKRSVEDVLVTLRGLLAAHPDDNLWWLPTDDPDLAAMVGLERDSTVSERTRATMAALLERSPQGSVQVERLLRRGRTDIAWPLLPTATPTDLRLLQTLWSAASTTSPTSTASPPSAATPSRTSDQDSAASAMTTRVTSSQDEEGLRAVVLPRESVTGSTDAPTTRAGVPLQNPDDLIALAADSRASALLTGSRQIAADTGAGATVQRMLGDSLAAWLEDPQAERSLLVAAERGTLAPAAVLEELTDGIASAPWVQPRSAGSILAGAATTAPAELTQVGPDPSALRDLTTYLQTPDSPLDPRSAASLTRLEQELEGLVQVLADDDAVRSWQPVLAGMWSTRWRASTDDWSRIWRHIRDDSLASRAALHVNPSTVNFLSDQGLMRVTIVNDLPVAVEDVEVELLSGSSILQIVDQPEPVSIGAGSRATVSFTARAVTRGQTTVTARLTAPNGTTLGDSTAVEVRVQPTGVWIYWVLGSIAGIVLVLGLVRTLRSTPRRVVAAASTPPEAKHQEKHP